jgi:hypothetical protein
MSSKHSFSKETLTLGQKTTLEWVMKEGWASGRKWQETEEYQELGALFPPLRKVWEESVEKDPEEFSRTLSHTFNAIAVYNRILSGSFPESGLTDQEIEPVREPATYLAQANPLIMPLILWLHDMGRLEDKEHHPERGAQLVKELDLLAPMGLTAEEALLVTQVIHSHLLVGTLYSGETSFLAFWKLLEDPEFFPFLSDPTTRELFVQALILFTMVDVWAYTYNARAISSAMISNYLRIAEELRTVLDKGLNPSEAKNRLIEIAKSSTDWRLCCYLRAFSQIGSKPHLTTQFYQQKVVSGAERFVQRHLPPEEWQGFKKQYLSRFHQIQFKYALGLLCLLSFKDLKKFREGCTPETEVDPRLCHLLTGLNNRLVQEEEKHDLSSDLPWDVIFSGIPTWTRPNNIFKQMEDLTTLEKIMAEGTLKTRNGKGLRALYLDFRPYWNYL